jgi:asparagine synthase (glutamine-hydrolysing)
MLGAMRHEPFYETGMWVDEAAGLYVGWSVRRGAFADQLPLRTERGNITLIFSGEDYPAPGTSAPLSASADGVPGEGPAAYLARQAEIDPSFPKGLNGRFHGLVLDHSANEAHLFNDRYGMHRLYYHEAQDGFYFAAEAKAILSVRPKLRRLHAQSAGELITCGSVLENRTLFEGIQLLPCGSKWTFSNATLVRKAAYFHPSEWEEQPRLTEEAYYEELRGVFSRNLPRYFQGRERIGVSLTGGLDTRMIMAWHKAAPQSLPCYTFGGMFRDNQDVRVARQVARACDQPHQVLPAGREMLARFAHYAERSVFVTDGCVGVDLAPDLYIYELARGIAPVRMTGNYGGEVLRNVVAFKPRDPMPGLFAQELTTSFEDSKRTYASIRRGSVLSFCVFRQAPWHHHGVLALEQTQLALRTPYLDNDLVQTVFQAPDSALLNNDACLRLIADGSPKLREIPTDRGVGGTQNGFASARNAYHEFLFKAEYAYDYGMPQGLAKLDHAFSAFHLERLFLGRHKSYHFRLWYRDALSNYVRDMLLDPRSLARPYIERRTVEHLVTHHLKGDRNYTRELHILLSLELIHRLFLDAGGH